MTRQHWLKTEDCNLDDLLRVLDDHTDPSDYPTAARIEQEVVVYDSGSVREALAAGRGGEIQEEIYRALADGPGIVVLTGVSATLLCIYNASVESLIHLYVIGVFTAFTLSQTGMVRHWLQVREPGWKRSAVAQDRSPPPDRVPGEDDELSERLMDASQP